MKLKLKVFKNYLNYLDHFMRMMMNCKEEPLEEDIDIQQTTIYDSIPE